MRDLLRTIASGLGSSNAHRTFMAFDFPRGWFEHAIFANSAADRYVYLTNAIDLLGMKRTDSIGPQGENSFQMSFSI